MHHMVALGASSMGMCHGHRALLESTTGNRWLGWRWPGRPSVEDWAAPSVERLVELLVPSRDPMSFPVAETGDFRAKSCTGRKIQG